MASLNTLRTKFGIVLSIVIAGALLAFILSLKTEMGFSGNDPRVGVINGKKINYSEYYNQYEQIKAQSGAQESDEQQSAMLANAAWQALIGKYVEYTSRKYLSQYGISVSEERLQASIAINFGGRREFYREYLSGHLSLDIQEGVSMIFSIFPRIIGIPPEEIDRALIQSLELFRRLPDTGIRFLV